MEAIAAVILTNRVIPQTSQSDKMLHNIKSCIQIPVKTSSLLPRGRFSVTKRCDQRGSKRTVAAKQVNKKLLRRDQVLQEIRLLQTLDHPNMVRLLDTYETVNSYVLVLEM